MNSRQHIIIIGDIKMNSMILGMCLGGMVTLACICSDLRHRIEVLERDNRKLKRDIEKLIENNQ
jgi:hypothetical protein